MDSSLIYQNRVERNTGILVACIPFLRPILHTPFMKSVFSLTSRTSNSRSYRRSGYSVHSDTNYELSNKVNNVNTRNSERSNVSIIDHTASDIKVSNDILPIWHVDGKCWAWRVCEVILWKIGWMPMQEGWKAEVQLKNNGCIGELAEQQPTGFLSRRNMVESWEFILW